MSKYLFAIYSDEDVLTHNIKPIRSQGVRIKEVYSPFPVHGMDHAIGHKRTRISICAFIYGIIGCCLAILMTSYMMIHDWPMDIGGKPNWQYYFNIPAFIPITFESTVFCAAHGMVITFLLRCKILPGVEPEVIDPRCTDDHYVMKVRVWDDQDENKIREMITHSGAVEIKAS